MSIYIDHIIMSSKMQKFGLLDSSVLFCIGSLVVSTMIVSYTISAFGTEQISVNVFNKGKVPGFGSNALTTPSDNC